MRAALWAALTGALTAVPETEPGWLWEAGHVISSVFLAYLIMCLLDVAWMRVRCALSAGSCAYGGVIITTRTETPARDADAELALVQKLPAADLVVWANPATWELLDAVDAHLAGGER